MVAVERMNRWFAMARTPGIGGDARFYENGWYVCDAQDTDETNLARPIHDEPCEDKAEAEKLAKLMNDEENGYR